MQWFQSPPPGGAKLVPRDARVDIFGCAVIPEGTVEIAARAFRGNANLRRVVLPASVRHIEALAFADCPNLARVQLNQGLLSLGSSVFSGCDKLRMLFLPESLQQVCAGSFDGLHLIAPLYNPAGTTLFRYFAPHAAADYAVPEGVVRLAPGAFTGSRSPQEVRLPRSLRQIDTNAFFAAALQRITLPATVERVQAEAFHYCDDLKTVEIQCDCRALADGIFCRCGEVQAQFHGVEADFATQLRLKGVDLLTRRPDLLLPREAVWQDAAFAALAGQAARGDAEAMMLLAELLEQRYPAPFYGPDAANFWRHRASRYGSAQAARWIRQWLCDHPRQRIPAAMPSNLSGNYSGKFLQAMGFSFFDPSRSYHLEPKAQLGLMEAHAWCDEDGPDEDGFGREDYYDWWLLDEFLQEIPGVPMVACCSHREWRDFIGVFRNQWDAAVAALQARNGSPQ